VIGLIEGNKFVNGSLILLMDRLIIETTSTGCNWISLSKPGGFWQLLNWSWQSIGVIMKLA
jgi:hypothetical protein